MKHRLSLRWRLTIMTGILVTAACLVLTLALNFSAVRKMDELQSYTLMGLTNENGEIEAASPESIEIFPELSDQITYNKEQFVRQSICILILILLLSCSLTWFLSGNVLKPLRQLNSKIQETQAQNLSHSLPIPASKDEVSQLTASFNDMLERLNDAFTSQKQFAANAAHELRTPLAVILTRLEVTQKQGTLPPQQYDQIFSMIHTQISRLTHVVNELLQITQMNTLPRSDRVDVQALAEEVICDLAQAAQEKHLTVFQEEGAGVATGSDDLLYRAIYNLMENAIKYNKPNGRVTVAVTSTDTHVFVRIADTGPGIPNQYWNDIFTPFFRVDTSRSRAMGGAGLGLALVHRIANLHGGDVRVLESSSQGTVFLLSFSR